MLKEITYTAFLFIMFFGIANAYLFIAKKAGIIDKPNERSSHLNPVIRGAGIILPIAWLLFTVLNAFTLRWVTLGLVIIAVVSFMDDIKPLPARARFIAHALSFSLLFFQLDLFNRLPWWAMLIMYILCIGIVNAFNFMDGINGITGMYGLSFFGTLFIFRDQIFPGINPGSYLENPFLFIIIALLVFGFYNFRKKATCFAGDVGSVSLGYLVLFYCCILIFREGWPNDGEGTNPPGQSSFFHPEYVILLVVYGVDSMLTIIHRLLLKENIFKAHRKHLYQYLCNELKWPHLVVATSYALLQLLINITFLEFSFGFVTVIILFLLLSVVYIISKYLIINSLKSVKPHTPS